MTQERKIEYDCAYMQMAISMGNLSYAIRNKVGAIILSKNGQIISQGFNGTPTGHDNCCENVECNHPNGYKMFCPTSPLHSPETKSVYRCKPCEFCTLTTKKSVLHAESNAIAKCAKWLNTTEGGTIYVTLSPCYECSKLIIQAGIKRVVFNELYRTTDGLDNLVNAGIIVEQLNMNTKTLNKWHVNN